jgi:hypothetical protein
LLKNGFDMAQVLALWHASWMVSTLALLIAFHFLSTRLDLGERAQLMGVFLLVAKIRAADRSPSAPHPQQQWH